MISQTSLQIIKALLNLSNLPAGEVRGVEVLAQQIRAPHNYLGKVLQRLVQNGIVVSKKGSGGGFRLARSPDEITLYEVVGFLQDVKRWEGCFMGKPACSASSPCCIHQRWSAVRMSLNDFLKNTTIADLKGK